MNKLIQTNTVKYINEVSDYLLENEEITFFTEKEIITVSTDSGIQLYSDYEGLCNDWLNTDIDKSDKYYRNPFNIEQMEYDKKSYYDYKKGVWFDLY